MGIQDLIITPVWLGIIYMLAFMLRPQFTDRYTRRYFLPGLTVKLIGGVAVGLIYQFYYGGGRPSGDTFNYFRQAGIVFEAFTEKPVAGIQLLLANGEMTPAVFDYATRIYWFDSPTEYFVIKVTALLSLLTAHTYAANALLFAAISFSGIWAMYRSFYRLFPRLHLEFAVAMLFIPSVFFWGSGILKDTITLGALGWATWAIIELFIRKRAFLKAGIILFLALYTIYSIKIYIVLCFLPAAILWIFLANAEKIRSPLLRIALLPMMLIIGGVLGYLAMVKIGEGNERYSLDKLSQTAEVTARWLTHVSDVEQGSGYTLGDDYDFSPAGMLRKAPLAVNVTLFRPYLWEAHNIVMLLSALESLATLLLTLWVLYKAGIGNLLKYFTAKPIITFCLAFALAFSFAVGISTYNFGSLVRYKIPMFPFYIAGLFILRYLAQQKQFNRRRRKRPKAVIST
jgi:hypothetical protein